MSLASGTRIGPYEVLSPLGVGGMGEVYRAKDTRLERIVALKVLPGGGAVSPETLQRFQREARAASALNHPNICTIYDVGADPPYIAMELLEGETLQQRLTRGPLTPAESVDVAVALADALDAAHGKGIVHRDIKPANVFLTDRGPKILDFGLAKAAGAASEATRSADARLTDPGTALGTMAYMSPEQVRAEPARPADGLVLLRRRSLRDDDRHASISRRQRRQHLRCDSQPGARRAGTAESRCAGGSRARH